MRVGFGFSTLEDSYSAGLQALKDAVSVSGEPSVIILFSTFNYDPYEIFRSIKENTKDSKLIGGTSSFIIVYDRLISRGISIITLSGEYINAVTFSQDKVLKGSDYTEMGRKVGKLFSKDNPYGGMVIIFFAPELADVPKILYSLYNTMGPKFGYVGGGCVRNPKASFTYTFTEKGVNTGPLALAVISGMEFSTAVGHGFESIKDPLIINKTSKNKIVEIDGIPAVDAYTRRFNLVPNMDLLTQMVFHPLGFPNLSGDYIIRDPIDIDKKAIVFPVEIPEGAVGYVMDGKVDRLIKSTSVITEKALRGITDPSFVLVFDCISRRSLMEDRFVLELKAIKDSIRFDIPITGMLTMGELCCYGDSPMFHNKSTVLVVSGREKTDHPIGDEIEKSDLDILEAELSILHEIASLSSLVSEEDLIESSIEKSVRLFGVRRSAFIRKIGDNYKLLASWGFNRVRDVLKSMSKDTPNKEVFSLGENGEYGVLYIEMNNIDERKRRLFRIFARRLEEIFGLLEANRERKKIERSLRKLALTDDLTKLYNRRGFLLFGEQYLKLSERLKRKAILLYIDVDNLKWINDNLGHSEGDRALIEIASILKKISRKSDILARIGGDEFVLLGLETGESNSSALLRRIRERLEAKDKKRHLPYNLSISMGVAVYDPDNPLSLRSLLEEADKKMYEEKRRKKELKL